jgi:hypothetical protein
MHKSIHVRLLRWKGFFATFLSFFVAAPAAAAATFAPAGSSVVG